MAGRYSDEEMKEILRRALEAEADTDGIEHEDLVAAAVEVGIDPAAIEQAAIELRDAKEAVTKVRAKQRKRRRQFVKSLASFGVVNAFLFAIDFLTPGGPWFFWPLLGWGLFVALHGLRVLPPMSADTERDAVETEMRRIARRRAKTAKRLSKETDQRTGRESKSRRAGAESAFEAAVDEGVTALLGALAGQLRRAVGPATDAQQSSRFERYVAHLKGGRTQHRGPTRPAQPAQQTPDAPVTRSVPKTRVAIDQAAAEVVEEELEAMREERHKRR